MNGVDHEKDNVKVVVLEGKIAEHIPIIYIILYIYIIVIYNIQCSYVLININHILVAYYSFISHTLSDLFGSSPWNLEEVQKHM